MSGSKAFAFASLEVVAAKLEQRKREITAVGASLRQQIIADDRPAAVHGAWWEGFSDFDLGLMLFCVALDESSIIDSVWPRRTGHAAH